MSGPNKLNEENGIATFVIAGRKLVRNSFTCLHVQHKNWNTKTSNIGLKRCLFIACFYKKLSINFQVF
jgi:hypothetical protein